MMQEGNEEAVVYDVVVIGAGAAGIAAARGLRAAGKKCVVLEGRQRVGGRAYTSDDLSCGVPLDHGGAWFHAHGAEGHPMAGPAKDVGIEMKCPGWGMGSKYEHELLWNGKKVAAVDRKAATLAFKRLTAVVDTCRESLAEENAPDCTWAEALLKACDATTLDEAISKMIAPGAESIAEVDDEESAGNPWSDEEEEEEEDLDAKGDSKEHEDSVEEDTEPDIEAQRSFLYALIGLWIENWEGVSLDRRTVIHAESCPMLEGPNADVLGGYGNMLVKLCDGLDVKLGHKVFEIEYPDSCGVGGHVIVRCEVANQQKEYSAKKCLVTLPLGVLKQGKVQFKPPLPDDKQGAIHALGVARMSKVAMYFPERFWPDDMRSLVLAPSSASGTRIPWAWWHEPPGVRKAGKAVLVCYTTGNFADEVEKTEESVLKSQCLSVLRDAFPSVPEPLQMNITKWLSDPFSLGCWSTFVAGSTPEHATCMSRPCGLGDCLVFAGEHTCDGSTPGLDMGTIHGAWKSGEVSAGRILSEKSSGYAAGKSEKSSGYAAGKSCLQGCFAVLPKLV